MCLWTGLPPCFPCAECAVFCKPKLPGQTPGHPVQPTRQAFALADRSGFPGQEQKCCLKHVVGQIGAGDQAPAKSKDHWAVPIDKSCEGRFVAGLLEAIQQLLVALLNEGFRQNAFDCSG